MRASLFIALFLSQSIMVLSQEIDVGIMRYYKNMSAVKVSQGEGSYLVFGDSTHITTVANGQTLYLERSGEKVKVERSGSSLGAFDTIYFKEERQNCSFKIQSISPSGTKVRQYEGNLLVFPGKDGEITTVNRINIDQYLAGVIESEGGGGKHPEYYKVQAILSRTYALDHLNKHRRDGFDVCNRVHCQAYYSMLKHTPEIRLAVEATKGIIMLDQHLDLADGYFFANCGGQTSESDFVWNQPITYCRSIVDTFCTRSWQATWTKKISKSSWKHYLTGHFGFNVNDSLFGDYLYRFNQPQRKAFYLDPRLGIPLRDLRTHFKLKSTWFDVRPEGDMVVLEGKGFGHGVGLCQEGAMNMAKQGYSYEQILKFYFTNIQLFDYFHWLFLRQEEVVGL